MEDLFCDSADPPRGERVAALACDRWVVTSALDELPLVRAHLRAFCRKHRDLEAIAEDLSKLELAVTEALSNIMKHAYEGRDDRPIQVDVELFADHIAVQFTHQGMFFAPELNDIPEPDGTSENHMGLYIIKQSVDQVKYYRSKNRENCILLIKNLKLVPRGNAGSSK